MVKERLLSPAKINLFLKVGAADHGGYHKIISLMHTIAIYDEILIERSDNYKLFCSNLSIPTDERNLISKAVRVFSDYFLEGEIPGIKITLMKKIPDKAGLGGGSSNAASIIKYLLRIFNKDLNTEFLQLIGKQCGYDIPFFFSGGFALIKDYGETVVSLDLKLDMNCLIIQPRFGLSTPSVYNKYDEITNNYPDLEEIEKKILNIVYNRQYIEYKELLEIMDNDLQNPAKAISEPLDRILDSIPADYKSNTMMTGSGSAIFTLLPSPENTISRIILDALPKNLIKKTVLTKFIDMVKVEITS